MWMWEPLLIVLNPRFMSVKSREFFRGGGKRGCALFLSCLGQGNLPLPLLLTLPYLVCVNSLSCNLASFYISSAAAIDLILNYRWAVRAITIVELDYSGGGRVCWGSGVFEQFVSSSSSFFSSPSLLSLPNNFFSWKRRRQKRKGLLCPPPPPPSPPPFLCPSAEWWWWYNLYSKVVRKQQWWWR